MGKGKWSADEIAWVLVVSSLPIGMVGVVVVNIIEAVAASG